MSLNIDLVLAKHKKSDILEIINYSYSQIIICETNRHLFAFAQDYLLTHPGTVIAICPHFDENENFDFIMLVKDLVKHSAEGYVLMYSFYFDDYIQQLINIRRIDTESLSSIKILEDTSGKISILSTSIIVEQTIDREFIILYKN